MIEFMKWYLILGVGVCAAHAGHLFAREGKVMRVDEGILHILLYPFFIAWAIVHAARRVE